MILLIILVLIAIVFIILTIIYLLALTRLYNNTPLARIRTLTRNSEHLITYAFIVFFIGVVVSLPGCGYFPYITSTLDQRKYLYPLLTTLRTKSFCCDNNTCREYKAIEVCFGCLYSR